jgi:rRNA processing protein Gar1
MKAFKAKLEIIGINPFVFVPEEILAEIFREARKDRGPIPVCGTINAKKYTQTLVKYSSDWRLYINTTMLTNSPKRIGETVEVIIRFDKNDRTIKPHPRFVEALNGNKKAKEVFDNLSPSMQKEIVHYIATLKLEGSVTKNIEKAIGFLLGKNRFVGRDRT